MYRSTSRGVRLSSVAIAVLVLGVSAWFNQAAACESQDVYLSKVSEVSQR